MRHPLKMTRAQRNYLIKTVKYKGDTYNVWFISESKEYFKFVDAAGNYYYYNKILGELSSEKGDTSKLN